MQLIPRFSFWALLSILLLLVLAYVSPKELPVILYKVTMVTIGCYLAYWIDRALYPYDRPHTYADTGEDLIPRGMAMLRRAIIVVACVLGLTFGL